jgi:hypothetical protein
MWVDQTAAQLVAEWVVNLACLKVGQLVGQQVVL